MLRWFYQVQRRIRAASGVQDTTATVVWGCKVAPTGRGNLSVPTDRVAQLAKRVKDWTVVPGDEYRTSAASCISPHSDNLSPRFIGKQAVRRTCRPVSLRSQVRRGFVLGLGAKRLLRRAEGKDKALRIIGKSCCKRDKQVTRWTYDGHSGETASEKEAKKYARTTAGVVDVKHVRGLRVCITDKKILKFVDRDVNGSSNIGIVWLGDNVAGFTRPDAFVRKTKPNATTGCITKPYSPLRTVGEGRKSPHSNDANDGMVHAPVSQTEMC